MRRDKILKIVNFMQRAENKDFVTHYCSSGPNRLPCELCPTSQHTQTVFITDGSKIDDIWICVLKTRILALNHIRIYGRTATDI
jgi:hypothetical protein